MTAMSGTVYGRKKGKAFGSDGESAGYFASTLKCPALAEVVDLTFIFFAGLSTTRQHSGEEGGQHAILLICKQLPTRKGGLTS